MFFQEFPNWSWLLEAPVSRKEMIKKPLKLTATLHPLKEALFGDRKKILARAGLEPNRSRTQDRWLSRGLSQHLEFRDFCWLANKELLHLARKIQGPTRPKLRRKWIWRGIGLLVMNSGAPRAIPAAIARLRVRLSRSQSRGRPYIWRKWWSQSSNGRKKVIDLIRKLNLLHSVFWSNWFLLILEF